MIEEDDDELPYEEEEGEPWEDIEIHEFDNIDESENRVENNDIPLEFESLKSSALEFLKRKNINFIRMNPEVENVQVRKIDTMDIRCFNRDKTNALVSSHKPQ